MVSILWLHLAVGVLIFIFFLLLISAQYYTLIGSVCQPLGTQYARFVGHDASGFDVSLALIYKRKLEGRLLTHVSFLYLPKITGAQFTPITSEGACYSKCAAVNINPKTAGSVSIVEFNLPNQYCFCKTTANLAYTNFVVSNSWNANLAGNCAMYSQSKLKADWLTFPYNVCFCLLKVLLLYVYH